MKFNVFCLLSKEPSLLTFTLYRYVITLHYHDRRKTTNKHRFHRFPSIRFIIIASLLF